MPLTRRTLLALPFAFAIGPAAAQLPPPWLERLRKGEVVGLLRHALAPGTGDPDNFRLGDCSTQRNLSDAGRKQAEAIGANLRRLGLDKAAVYSSQWCRCLETARLLGYGRVQDLPALNSFFSDRSQATEQTRQLDAWLAGRSDPAPQLLVTHQVNITALTGVVPASGELVLITREKTSGSRVVARETLG
jgi:phosphohistidine phosphatase SixA